MRLLRMTVDWSRVLKDRETIVFINPNKIIAVTGNSSGSDILCDADISYCVKESVSYVLAAWAKAMEGDYDNEDV